MSMDTTRAPTPAPTSAPTNLACAGLSRSEAMLSILSEATDEMTLLRPNSPQGVAYLWVLDGDPAMVDPCSYSTVKQRYTLAFFYYTTGGAFWAFDTTWLSASNECTWMGVSCDDGGLVTGLLLGTYLYLADCLLLSLERRTNVISPLFFLLLSLDVVDKLVHSQWETT